MQFTRRLRESIKQGEITVTIRIWKSARVKPGNHYKLDDGHIVVEKINQIEFDDITPRLARESGFSSVADLLKTAKHGAGENIYLIRFRYEAH